MGQSTQSNQSIGYIVAEILLLFILGILGNILAEKLKIPAIIVILLIIIGLVTLIWINYRRNRPRTHGSIQSSFLNSRPDWFPKTMVDVFPYGVIFGLLLGFILPFVINTDDVGGNYYYFFRLAVGISESELLGIVLGSASGLLLALTVDGPWAASLVIGYGIGLATGLINSHVENHGGLYTYFGHILYFFVAASLFYNLPSLLSKIHPFWEQFKEQITRERF